MPTRPDAAEHNRADDNVLSTPADASPRCDRRDTNAGDVDLWHGDVDFLKHRIGEAVVVPEAAAEPSAPAGHAAAGMQFES